MIEKLKLNQTVYYVTWKYEIEEIYVYALRINLENGYTQVGSKNFKSGVVSPHDTYIFVYADEVFATEKEAKQIAIQGLQNKIDQLKA